MTKHKTKVDVKILALTAMFAAVVTIATSFIKIGDGSGYTHPGDSMVYLSACILPGPYGIIASSIGGFFADLLAGYPQWALITAVIKALNALPFVICRYFLKKLGKDDKIINLPILLMLIPTTLITVFGYFFGNILLISWEYAVAGLLTWYIQPGVGAILFVALGIAFDAIGFKQKVITKSY